MFGWDQPSLEEAVGKHGRTKLSGIERPHDYQASAVGPGVEPICSPFDHRWNSLEWNGRRVLSPPWWHVYICIRQQQMRPQVSISFPGADFDKGEGQYAALTDHTGKNLASSGTEMAEAVQGWIVQGWLDGNEQQGKLHSPSYAQRPFACS